MGEKKTKVTYSSLVDPKGWIPKSVVNIASKTQALCVVEIRKQLEKKWLFAIKNLISIEIIKILIDIL